MTLALALYLIVDSLVSDAIFQQSLIWIKQLKKAYDLDWMMLHAH